MGRITKINWIWIETISIRQSVLGLLSQVNRIPEAPCRMIYERSDLWDLEIQEGRTWSQALEWSPFQQQAIDTRHSQMEPCYLWRFWDWVRYHTPGHYWSTSVALSLGSIQYLPLRSSHSRLESPSLLLHLTMTFRLFQSVSSENERRDPRYNPWNSCALHKAYSKVWVLKPLRTIPLNPRI